MTRPKRGAFQAHFVDEAFTTPLREGLTAQGR
jgi:hypothetical protein